MDERFNVGDTSRVVGTRLRTLADWSLGAITAVLVRLRSFAIMLTYNGT